jgi:kynurenine formamidase
MKEYIDLSHDIRSGEVTYKGLPAPLVCDYLSRLDAEKQYAPGVTFQIGKIEMVSNTGTYIDTPFHRFEHGHDLSQIELNRLTDLEGIVVETPYKRFPQIEYDCFKGLPLKGKAILVHTGWDAHWGTDKYFEGHPYLTKSAAEYLLEQQVRLVGIDAFNIDDVKDPQRPVHTVLLGNNILIVEHLCNINSIRSRPFFFNAVPPKVCGMGTFPVRAYATIG